MARVLAVSVATVSAAAAGAPDLSQYTYEQWMSEYGVNADAEAEAIFNKNLADIVKHNAESEDLWLAPNKFMTMHSDAFKKYVKGRSQTRHLFQGAAQQTELDFSAVPASIDWRETPGVVTDVKDQGSCGSCWAFSSAETLESHLAIATGSTPKLSPQQIVSCAPNPNHCGGTGGCDGSTQPLAFDYTKTAGITTDENYPYTQKNWKVSHLQD